MARLPSPGQDQGTWGDILNEYLRVSHNDDGSLKPIDQNQVVGLGAALGNKVSNQNLTDGLNTKANQTDLDSLEAAVQEKASTADLSTVATSGSYTDLTNTPTIPDMATLVANDDLDAKTSALVDDTASATNVSLKAAFLPRGDVSFTGVQDAPFLQVANGSNRESIHLTQGLGFTGAYLLGIGNDTGDKPGLLISNKAAGVAQVIKQNPSITSAAAYALQVDQQSTMAPGVRLDMNVDGGADLLQLLALKTQTSKNTKLLYVGDQAGQVGFIRAIDGVLQWQRDVRITDNPANQAARYLELSTPDGNPANVTRKNFLGSSEHIFFGATGSAGVYYPYRLSGSGSTFALQTAANLTAATPTDPRPSEVTTWNTVLGARNNALGFFGSTPSAKATISGSRSGNAALTALLTELAAKGLITDGTTA